MQQAALHDWWLFRVYAGISVAFFQAQHQCDKCLQHNVCDKINNIVNFILEAKI